MATHDYVIAPSGGDFTALKANFLSIGASASVGDTYNFWLKDGINEDIGTLNTAGCFVGCFVTIQPHGSATKHLGVPKSVSGRSNPRLYTTGERLMSIASAMSRFSLFGLELGAGAGGTGGDYFVYVTSTSGLDIGRCLLVNEADPADTSDAIAIISGSTPQSYIYSNIISKFGHCAIRGGSHGAAGLYLIGNTCYGNMAKDPGADSHITATTGLINKAQNNLVFDVDYGYDCYSLVSGTRTTNASSDSTGSTGLQGRDPATDLTNTGSSDFNLKTTSTLIGAGTSQTDPFDIDITGAVRHTPWCVGAYHNTSGLAGNRPRFVRKRRQLRTRIFLL